MPLLESILVGLALFLPFFFLVILPTILAYFYGNKALIKAKELYGDQVKRFARKLFGNVKVLGKGMDKLNHIYVVETKPSSLRLEFSLVERRTYAYYFAKLFGGIDDVMFIKVNLDAAPPSILYMVSRHRRKLVEKSSKYIYALDELNLGGLSEDILALSDNVRFASKYFDRKILNALNRFKKAFNYVVVDYKAPHIELSVQIKESEADIIGSCMEFVSGLISNIKKVRGKGKESDVLTFIRKILKEEK